MPVDSLTEDLGRSTTAGLTSAGAAALLTELGANVLPEARRTPWWERVFRQLHNPIIYILLFALAFDAVVWTIEGMDGWPIESIAILVILAFNTTMGLWQEYRAEDALARLEELAAPYVWVRRDGILSHVPAAELVPGDLVRVESGDRIPADGELTSEQGLMVDESMLTGESVPIERAVGEALYSGTLAVRGLAWIVVTRTGADSAMGQIAGMLASVKVEGTPLERRLTHFGHRVARWVAALAVVLVVAGVGIEGIDRIDEALLFAVAVAVAAVPEGLPAVLTLTLALGTERMASRKAVVRRLAAVETLGSVTVIATDKTGTLTENAMTVRTLDSPDEDRALLAMVLASDAEPDGGSGDPLEVGLYRYATDRGIDPVGTRARFQRQSVRSFDSAWKYMRVTVLDDDALISYLKGAPEVLLERAELTPEEKSVWTAKIVDAATDGYRVLALAWARGERETDIGWLGIVTLWDPPRAEVPDAIDASQQAGIRVQMITGDHPTTARAIANAVGIATDVVVTGEQLDRMSGDELARSVRDVGVFARVSPEHKLALVEAHKANGEIVAMTGDGVNDAPALKRADIGIAMGRRGSDVSREVADLVLLDDNFATITAAIDEGRSIYANILKFVRFLFSTNVALVLLIAIGVTGAAALNLQDDFGNLLVPLLAVQLLWINIIADGPPALALGMDRNPGMMSQRPRPPSAPLLTQTGVRFILTTGALKAAMGVLLFFSLPALAFSGSTTQTAVFLYESLAQLAFVYPARRITNRSLPNRTLNIIIVASVGLQVLTITVPGLRTMLGLVPLDGAVLALIATTLLVTVAGAEIWSRRLAQREDNS
ncbi:MAG: cation-transporting P-type ATPase [Actinomycetota bacterium]|nr:cation-transporting P-type ATPase [Actinomycetota bacterium]